MRQVIIDSPKQILEGFNLAKNIKIDANFKNVVVCGVGGSALPVNVLNTIAKTSIPVFSHRDYGLPSLAGADSLITCISYSGNTEETISALEAAIEKDLKIVGLASGGKLEQICRQKNIPFVKIPSGIQPRCATGYIFSALAKILSNIGVADNLSDEISNSAKELEKTSPLLEKQGKKLAKKLFRKIPVIYASNNFKAVSRIWKIKLNENSKVPAFHNYFPELNHNEMVGYTKIQNSKFKIQNFIVMILRDKADHPRILKRMKLTALLLKKSGIKTEFIDIKDGSVLFKVFSALLLGDWTSYYLALLNKIDPTPVKMVEDFKNLMEK